MDGSYLSEHLVSLGYKVVGVIRRQSTAENQTSRLNNIIDKITTVYGDVTDAMRMSEIVREVQPDEVYFLAAQSHVKVSWDMPAFTVQTNAVGILNCLEAVRQHCPWAKTYTAASSECFGRSVDQDGYQREGTGFSPTSPYGCAKVFAYNITQHYRHAHGMFAVNGILFNHSSARRGATFVEAKIAKTAAAISALRFSGKLQLGNIHPSRDFGHSKDYVRAMHLMLQHDKPDDWVVASGETHSIADICRDIFAELGMDWRDHVEFGVDQFKRPEELLYLRGDSSKIRNRLKWHPEVSYQQLITELAARGLEVSR